MKLNSTIFPHLSFSRMLTIKGQPVCAIEKHINVYGYFRDGYVAHMSPDDQRQYWGFYNFNNEEICRIDDKQDSENVTVENNDDYVVIIIDDTLKIFTADWGAVNDKTGDPLLQMGKCLADCKIHHLIRNKNRVSYLVMLTDSFYILADHYKIENNVVLEHNYRGELISMMTLCPDKMWIMVKYGDTAVISHNRIDRMRDKNKNVYEDGGLECGKSIFYDIHHYPKHPVILRVTDVMVDHGSTGHYPYYCSTVDSMVDNEDFTESQLEIEVQPCRMFHLRDSDRLRLPEISGSNHGEEIYPYFIKTKIDENESISNCYFADNVLYVQRSIKGRRKIQGQRYYTIYKFVLPVRGLPRINAQN